MTLGCKVNQYETQALEELLRQRGHEVGTDGETDAVIINTCAVTAESGRKSKQAIRHARRENPEAIIGVCGCFSQVSPEEVEKLEADLISGSGDRRAFVENLEKVFNEHRKLITGDNALKRRNFELLPSGGLSGRTRAMLKIQDGCNNFCSYCIIPYARGPVRSMTMDDAAAETEKLRADGYKELVVTGIEIASYGWDFHNGIGLIDVLEVISKNAGDMRIRLGSLEPTVITEDFCKRLTALENICGHFHLSLQSGCDNTLKRMRRKYTAEQFYEVVDRLRRAFPNCGITTDLITGFPGETEEDFNATLKFIQKCGFSAMHIFPYSKRPGTPAADMEGQISNSEKKERSAAAIAVADAMEKEFLHSQVGKTLDVLFETEYKNGYKGHSKNYCEVAAQGEALHNIEKRVKITGVEGNILLGDICG